MNIALNFLDNVSNWIFTFRGAAVREVFEEFNNNCSSYLIASGYVCIDECQYPLRNQWGGKCYNPSKPNKACANEYCCEVGETIILIVDLKPFSYRRFDRLILSWFCISMSNDLLREGFKKKIWKIPYWGGQQGSFSISLF